jgi:hypothetical protein
MAVEGRQVSRRHRIGTHLRAQVTNGRDWLRWRRGQWSAPSAPSVKRAVLARHYVQGSTWVETGTYRGDTTAYLAKLAPHVISIEPDDVLYREARRRFEGVSRVTLIHGTSEGAFEEAVLSISGPACFWLDGHYSGPGTHLADLVTPILWELDVIGRHLGRLEQVAVLIDDFREFPSRSSDRGASRYPDREVLVEWAVMHGLDWTVEHDIFIATSGSGGA